MTPCTPDPSRDEKPTGTWPGWCREHDRRYDLCAAARAELERGQVEHGNAVQPPVRPARPVDDQVLTDVRFWQQVTYRSKQTVVCSPDLESRCKGYVAARQLEHLIAVVPSKACPDNRLYVIDHDAMGEHAVRSPLR